MPWEVAGVPWPLLAGKAAVVVLVAVLARRHPFRAERRAPGPPPLSGEVAGRAIGQGMLTGTVAGGTLGTWYVPVLGTFYGACTGAVVAIVPTVVATLALASAAARARDGAAFARQVRLVCAVLGVAVIAAAAWVTTSYDAPLDDIVGYALTTVVTLQLVGRSATVIARGGAQLSAATST